MKKAISVLLSVLIITASAAAGLTALASDDGFRIAVASDLHYLHTGEELEGNIDDEIYLVCQQTCRHGDRERLHH